MSTRTSDLAFLSPEKNDRFTLFDMKAAADNYSILEEVKKLC